MASSFDGHVPKRQKTEEGGRSYDDQVDRHNPEISAVVHVRGLPDHVTEDEIVNAVQHFGPVEYVLTIPRRHQALVEFQDTNGSKACVNFASSNQLYIGGGPAYFNYSTSQKIQRQNADDQDGEGGSRGRAPASENKILLFTVMNAQYPITVDVMHTICSPHGHVEKIVIFKKHYVQSMVQFEALDSAKRAKQQLHGCDVYSGCCTLRIEYAKTSQLNVRTNNNESWDYTLPAPGVEAAPRKNPPLLADPRFTAAPTPYSEFEEYPSDQGGLSRGATPAARGFTGNQYDQGETGYDGGYASRNVGRGAPLSPQAYGGAQQRAQAPYGQQGRTSFGRGAVDSGRQDQGGYGGGYSQGPQGFGDQQVSSGMGNPQQGCVLMLYGLHPDQMNCDRVFNLLCLYGNVIRVKFLKSKEGAAMVQLGDSAAVERAMFNLGGANLFNRKLILTHSKQAFLQDVVNPHELPDNTSSFKDFMGSRSNRFSTPESAAKNRIIHPTEILHFYNAPPKITEDELKDVFVDAGVKAPTKVLQFASKSEKSSTGLVEWDTKSDALEALALVNHILIPNPGGRPYVMKLCFSQSNIRDNQK